MGAENADLKWSYLWAVPSEFSIGSQLEYGRSRAVVQAMNEARQKPKRICHEELVPPKVRAHYEALWQDEYEQLVAEEDARLAEQARWASLWWWQKVRETLWPTR